MALDLLPLVALPFCLLFSWEILLRRHIRRVLRGHLRRTGIGVHVSFEGYFPGRPSLSVLAPPETSAHARLQTEAFEIRLWHLLGLYRWTVGPLREPILPAR